LSRKDFAAAATDKEVTKDEYSALVEKRFMAADADHSGMAYPRRVQLQG